MQLPGEVGPPGSVPKEPDVLTVTFGKVHGSMGLSIVAAKGEGQEKRGIYIKSVVPGGAAALVSFNFPEYFSSVNCSRVI